MAFNPTPKQVSLIKGFVFVAALLPFLWGALQVFGGELVEPLEYITHETGDWALYLLCITLAITPVRRLTGWNWLVKLRRMLGVYTFFYALLHFIAFFWFDHFFDFAAMLRDVAKRPFILVGFTAFVLLIPLAATSTNGMIKRLGGKRWQWLHKLIYVIAPLAVLHFWWMKAAKNNLAQPALFAAIVIVLLGLRFYWSRAKARTVARA
ncbi:MULTISPECIES: sulfite oxidase heme-binding subunit YedZ [unclassified Massilia]|uniref:sulfite oxidase heme-binding subunit YedZ n=1 Tax=unclassified Massilia TaxID=2609279 RepID=UPI00177BAB97|nr:MULTISPECIES: protein-methionine-sulfoxide reductase heme-binding subunit MsrQ [unclassified Massilia]MBD8533328.1 sulfoxide reductase heme-binding subunit YedZ [Massilia sp. CFBP 13647]MBD8676713.1 sulfoxide reductase heme-binding subunit YedZ [Massilia sp. CFBP 13721]